MTERRQQGEFQEEEFLSAANSLLWPRLACARLIWRRYTLCLHHATSGSTISVFLLYIVVVKDDLRVGR
jgi:hypothetical protein